jgi:ubiquinone/menaquinone biosynthesis C-methylase UbiE
MAYTGLDRFVARCRFRAAIPHIKPQSSVCDVGCGLDAAFLTFAGSRIARGIGIDDQAETETQTKWPVIRADIYSGLPFADNEFEHVVMLAVLEHLKDPEIVLKEEYRILRPGGSLVLTWPQSLVDPLLGILHWAGLVSKEMESEEHQKRIPLPTLVQILTGIGFQKFYHRRFELGLNNLLVARKPEA